MPLFKLSATIGVSAYTQVRAKTREEAIEIASQRQAELAGFGHEDRKCWIVEEADGMPQDVAVVSEEPGGDDEDADDEGED